MSTGKRLAKRSIVGTRVCVQQKDGKFYTGVIQAVKTPANFLENNNCINLTPNTRYTVHFDQRRGLPRMSGEYFEHELIGPGFRTLSGLQLVPGQKCYVTFNGREVTGEVIEHNVANNDVVIKIHQQGCENMAESTISYIHKKSFEVQKKLDEVRLLESRKSARLADQDTDFARLADMAGDRKRTSHNIDVPAPSNGSRKRRPSYSQDDSTMDECSAALVLMSLSCSPHSPNFNGFPWLSTSPDSTMSSSSASYRSTPSPPPRNGSPVATTDEGIFMDYYEDVQHPKKKKLENPTRIVFQCTWPSCVKSTYTCESIEAHVRQEHLKSSEASNGEEEFYYTEVEMGLTSPPPTLSHRDMARPPHEDPDYQRQIVGNYRQNLLSQSLPTLQTTSNKVMKLSPSPYTPKMSPRRFRGENKKCRKFYGMDRRDLWCTQCKWKKACTRFSNNDNTKNVNYNDLLTSS